MLIFHPALASYRIDQFNNLNELFDLEVVFLFDKLWNFDLNQQKIVNECRFRISYLLKGPRLKGRLFRFGMYKKIKQVEPDIILGYEYSITTQYLVWLKKTGLIKQKIGSFVDDSPDICNNVQSKLREWFRNRTVKQLNFIVLMSKQVASYYQDRFRMECNQLIVSPILQFPGRLRKETTAIEWIAENYIRKYRFKGKKVILFVGRFIPEKALPLFIENISSELAKRDDIVMVLVGEGQEKEILMSLISDKKLEGKVVLPGKFQGEELYAWYASASGFVLPSVSETFGAVVNEALIFGLSVLCSQYAGAASLIHQENGMLFNPLDNTDTLEKFKCYLDSLKPMGNVCLADTPPLIDQEMPDFINEWKKTEYE